MQRTQFCLLSVKLVVHCILKNRQIEMAIHWNYIYTLTISYFRNLVDINVEDETLACVLGRFPLILSELTGQTIPVEMINSLLIKTILPDQSNPK